MIVVNLDKAKQIAHEKRRNARSQEFAPLDVKASIPSEASSAEAARQQVREKYEVIQYQIDAAGSVEELKSVMPK